MSKEEFKAFDETTRSNEGDWPEDQIRLTTRYAIMHTGAQIVATIALLFASDLATALTMSLFIVAYIPTYVAHWRRWPLFGRVWSPVAGMTVTAAFHIVMGPEWHIGIILLSQVVLPFCIFTQRERRLTLLFAILPAVLFVVLTGFVDIGPFVTHGLTPTQVRWFSMLVPAVAGYDIYSRIRLLLDRIHRAADEADQARKTAVLANRAKSAFLANVSHEIRTPMNAVVAMSDLLVDTHLDAEQKQMVTTMSASAKGLLSVINDILDYSKIEAQETTLNVVPFDLHDCLEEVVGVLTMKAEEKRLSFNLVVDHRVPIKLEGAQDRLKQVLYNLIGNAIKYTAKGYVRVHVSAQSESEETVVLHISVDDSGIGISEEDQAQVFDSFFQVDGSMTREYGGTGLGLAISKQIAMRLGGSIALHSVLGKGSTFHFTVPFMKQTPSLDDASPNAPGAHRILVLADPTQNVGDTLKELLLRLSYHDLMFAPSSELTAERLIEKFERRSIDLVICDCDALPPETTAVCCGIFETPGVAETKWILLKKPGGFQIRPLPRPVQSAVLYKPIRLRDLDTCLTTLLTAPPPDKSPTPAPSIEDSPNAELVSRKVRILVVEDNRVNQMVAMKIIEKLGYESKLAVNGQAAVDLLKNERFDIVLMDQQMPVLDGIAATKAIRNPQNGVLDPTVPIIAVTASAMKGDKEVFLAAGMNDYLAKPIIPNELSQMIGRWLEENNNTQVSDRVAST